MSDYLSEEEQLERLKRWWNENGRSTIVGVVLAVVAYFGWQGWQAQKQQKMEEASILYEELLQVVENTATGQTLTEEQITTAFSIADELKEKYSGGLYASNGALFSAKLAVEQGQLDKAEEELRWVLGNSDEQPMTLIARQRLAQVLFAKGQHDDALNLLNSVAAGNFSAGFAELRGDIYIAKQQLVEARAAYQVALNEMNASQGERRNIVQMKLDDIDLPDESTTEADAAEVDG